jgi:hypothetical protein
MLLICMLFVFSGCSNNAFDENEVKEFVMEYKTNQYTVEDASNPPTAVEIGEKVKPYLSEEEYENFFINRYFRFITVVAENTGYSSELQDVILEKTEENEDGSVDYDYTVSVKYYDDSFSELVETKGQMTIQYDGEDYKITRDWEQPNQFIREVFLKKK